MGAPPTGRLCRVALAIDVYGNAGLRNQVGHVGHKAPSTKTRRRHSTPPSNLPAFFARARAGIWRRRTGIEDRASARADLCISILRHAPMREPRVSELVEGVRTHRGNRALARQGAAGLSPKRPRRAPCSAGVLIARTSGIHGVRPPRRQVRIALRFQLRARSLPPDFTTLPLAIHVHHIGHDKVEQTLVMRNERPSSASGERRRLTPSATILSASISRPEIRFVQHCQRRL